MTGYLTTTVVRRGAQRPPLLSLALLLVPPVIAGGCDPPSEPAVVVIEPSNPPALVAFREEADPQWKAVIAERDGTFRVRPAGPYHVVIACEWSAVHPSSVWIMEYARTPEDGPSVKHECVRDTYDFNVRGQVGPPGVAYFGTTSRAGYDPQWGFDFPVVAGSYDLFIRVDAQLAIRRDLAISAYTDLGPIDFTLEDTVTLVPVTFRVSNQQPDEIAKVGSHLDTGSTTAVLQEPMTAATGWTSMFVPESALRATDRQIATVSASRIGVGPKHQSYRRSSARDVRVSDPPSLALPEPLGPVTFEKVGDRLTATVSLLPEHDEVTLRWTTESGGVGKDHRIELSRAFLDAATASSIALELAGIPSFRDEWRHAPEVQQRYELFTNRRLPGELESSSVSELTPRVLPAGPTPRP